MSTAVRASVTERVHPASMSVAWMRGALVAALAAGSSCAAPHPPPPQSPLAEEAPELPGEALGPVARLGPVVLVTIDGARWQEVFEGTDAGLSRARTRPSRELMPNLDRMAEQSGAAVGAPGRGLIRATGPNFVSLPGYTEILTGRAPITCQDNDCPAIQAPTLLDEVRATGGKVAAFGSWEVLDRAISARPGSFLVSCGRGGDASIDPWPGSGDFRPDRLTGALALRHLEAARPDVLYVGLGEPDEYGHHGDYSGYLRALREADAFVGQLVATLGRMGERGAATHVFVTADHGRARDFNNHGGGAPESARVWLVASGPSITARGRVASAHERHLADVAPTLRRVLGLQPDRQARSGWRGHPLDELFAAAER
jgi:hypothetical protein